MLKKPVLIFLATLFLTAPVFAEEISPVVLPTEAAVGTPALFRTKQSLLEQKRTQFREQLQEIKDAQKQRIVEQLEKKLNDINQQMVNRLTQTVERLEGFLDRLNVQANLLSEKGGNIAEAITLIDTTREELSEFKTKLETQTGKTYTPTLTTESSLRTDVGAVHQELRNDFKALRDELMAIKEQVISIVKLLVSVRSALTVTPALTPENQ